MHSLNRSFVAHHSCRAVGRRCRTRVRLAHPPHSAVREHVEGCHVSIVMSAVREHVEGCHVSIVMSAVRDHAEGCDVSIMVSAVRDNAEGCDVSIVMSVIRTMRKGVMSLLLRITRILNSVSSLVDFRIYQFLYIFEHGQGNITPRAVSR